ncbi:MAG: hypothetical protein KC656_14135, partial [Myxococcales bacterium]|nr:hypothetical protein [Myxococcales bacterium]
GEILAIYEGHGLVKLDRDSNVIWSWAEPAHHDLEVLDDGRIWVLARKARVVEDLNPRRAILEDFAVLLGPDGKEQKRVSLLEAVRATAEPVMNHIPRMRGDIFHTNSLEVLDGRVPDPRFKAGNLLLSARVPSVVFVVDPDLGKAVWWNHGEYRKQHDPSILPDGHMLLFDNIGLGDGRSAVRELTVPMMEEVWSYRASEENPFFSRFCGAAQRLPNGNTLISESGVGRVLEVDPAGKVVWRFDNPARAGENQEFVAIVPELVRLPASVMDGWTPSAGTP